MLQKVKSITQDMIWGFFRKDKVLIKRAHYWLHQRRWAEAFAAAQEAFNYFKKHRLSSRLERLEKIAWLFAHRGQMNYALQLLDLLWQFAPEDDARNLQRYGSLGSELQHHAKIPESIECWVHMLRLRKTCAEKEGLTEEATTYLNSDWTIAYGHIACISSFIKKGILENKASKIILVTKTNRVANRALVEYLSPWVEIHYDLPADQPLSRKALLLGQPHMIFERGGHEADSMADMVGRVQSQWRQEGRKALLQLTPEHKRRGLQLLENLGVAPGQWFVTLHVRTTASDFAGRNSALETYAEAVNWINQRGGAVVRIGEKQAQPQSIPGLIDYASSPYREEWADVFLAAACRFFWGTTSGPQTVADEFDTPSVLVNWLPLAHSHASDLFFIPKRLWHREQERYLTFTEMLQPPYEYMTRLQLLQEQGVEVVANTPEEIRDCVEEKLARLEGTVRYTPEDEERQQRFLNIMCAYRPYYRSRIGSAFLRQHSHLLD